MYACRDEADPMSEGTSADEADKDVTNLGKLRNFAKDLDSGGDPVKMVRCLAPHFTRVCVCRTGVVYTSLSRVQLQHCSCYACAEAASRKGYVSDIRVTAGVANTAFCPHSLNFRRPDSHRITPIIAVVPRYQQVHLQHAPKLPNCCNTAARSGPTVTVSCELHG